MSGYTPLHLAVISGRLDVVHILLADPRVNTSVLHGASVTPLYRAIEAELDNVVVALLESGKVNVNASVSAHVSPIYPAAAMGHETLLRILLDHPGSDLVREIGGTDIEDPSACEYTFPDASRNKMTKYFPKGNSGWEARFWKPESNNAREYVEILILVMVVWVRRLYNVELAMENPFLCSERLIRLDMGGPTACAK